jgi:hypothetical protein
MKILIVLIINFILTLFTYMIVLLDSNVPLKDYMKSLKQDIKYIILIYMTFNLGYLIQNICKGGLIYGK